LRALLRSRRHESDDPGLGALSPVAGSPLRARPFPPLSATTENGFRGPTPPTDFCNQSTEQGHTRQTTIPRAELAFSTLSVCPEPVRTRSCERYGTGAFASDLAPVRAPPHRPEDNEPACAQWRRGRLDRLPSTSCHPLRGRKLWAACDFEREGRGLLPARRANGRAFCRPRCLRSLETSPGALGPQGAARLGPPPLSRREPATRHAIFRHPRRVA
jgi:hypothetical protein